MEDGDGTATGERGSVGTIAGSTTGNTVTAVGTTAMEGVTASGDKLARCSR